MSKEENKNRLSIYNTPISLYFYICIAFPLASISRQINWLFPHQFIHSPWRDVNLKYPQCPSTIRCTGQDLHKEPPISDLLQPGSSSFDNPKFFCPEAINSPHSPHVPFDSADLCYTPFTATYLPSWRAVPHLVHLEAIWHLWTALRLFSKRLWCLQIFMKGRMRAAHCVYDASTSGICFVKTMLSILFLVAFLIF